MLFEEGLRLGLGSVAESGLRSELTSIIDAVSRSGPYLELCSFVKSTKHTLRVGRVNARNRVGISTMSCDGPGNPRFSALLRTSKDGIRSARYSLPAARSFRVRLAMFSAVSVEFRGTSDASSLPVTVEETGDKRTDRTSASTVPGLPVSGPKGNIGAG